MPMARSRGPPRAAGFRELTSAEAVRVGSLQADILYPPSVRALLRACRPRHFNRKADLVAASQHRGKVALESRYTVTNCYSSAMICDSSVRNWRDTVANLDLAREAPTATNVTVKAPRDYLTEREVEKLMDAAGRTVGGIVTRLRSCWPTVTGCVPVSLWACVGMTSTGKPRRYTCGAPRAV
jgi:hypothetical protein